MADSWCAVHYIGATHVTIVMSSNGDHGKRRELLIAHKRQRPECKGVLSAVSVAKGAVRNVVHLTDDQGNGRELRNAKVQVARRWKNLESTQT